MTELNLDEVRAKAKELGVDYHPAMKAETIQLKIDEYLATAGEALKPAVKAETVKEAAARADREAMALYPIIVTSMDPQDAAVSAVNVSVGNRRLGQVSKVIPFGQKWYMPKILIDELETKHFIRNSMVPTPGGNERLKSDWIKKYAIQYLPLPTRAELEELAKLQLQGNELAK